MEQQKLYLPSGGEASAVLAVLTAADEADNRGLQAVIRRT